ncbi:MAG: bifunctional chorismate mutase/prephenate dehydratase [Bacillota bacterium]|jgi:chorismate mutase/prephenate dehydratase
MRDLEQCRNDIDNIDRQLVRLFEKRMALSREIALIKEKAGLSIYDHEREDILIKNRLDLLREKNLATKLKLFFHTLMDLSKEEQAAYLTPNLPTEEKSITPITAINKEQAIAYQGVPGAYSHQALYNYFGPQATSISCTDFAQVLSEVLKQDAAYGILPAENSTTGSINRVYDMLVNYPVSIVGEIILPIYHCILGLPQAQLADIKEIYSHEQGFEQCRPFLEKYPQWEKRPYHNTALSAKYIKERADIHKAAIASAHAAHTYGLKILAENIQAQQENSTRFFIITNQSEQMKEGSKLTFTFTLAHQSGSLYHVLQILAQKDWNLTHIESRPIPGKNFEYRFFADIVGKFSFHEALLMLKQLEPYVRSCRLLGLYQKAGKAHG